MERARRHRGQPRKVKKINIQIDFIDQLRLINTSWQEFWGRSWVLLRHWSMHSAMSMACLVVNWQSQEGSEEWAAALL